MTITIIEFKNNFDKYLKLLEKEDVFIVKNGRVIAQMSKPKTDKLTILDKYLGLAKCGGEVSLDDIRDERLSKQ